ncbi:MAG: hypothetical protein JOS17DRAFT_304784 [Linnemannia elongata]|nr:MAG: hypothetical protein JOS17DRAFT_304784 [Linnemannia elongata]
MTPLQLNPHDKQTMQLKVNNRKGEKGVELDIPAWATGLMDQGQRTFLFIPWALIPCHHSFATTRLRRLSYIAISTTLPSFPLFSSFILSLSLFLTFPHFSSLFLVTFIFTNTSASSFRHFSSLLHPESLSRFISIRLFHSSLHLLTIEKHFPSFQQQQHIHPPPLSIWNQLLANPLQASVHSSFLLKKQTIHIYLLESLVFVCRYIQRALQEIHVSFPSHIVSSKLLKT